MAKRLQTALLACLIVLLLMTTPASAASWLVTREGNGDFLTIQEAVDIAASGDTIYVGPGYYDDFQWLALGNSAVYVISENKDLTFIGEGPDRTFVGFQNPPFAPNVYLYGIVAKGQNDSLHVEGIGFNDMNGDAIRLEGGHLEVSNCDFQNTVIGIFAFAHGGGYVRNCNFDSVGYRPSITGGVSVGFTTDSDGVVVENCMFENCWLGVGYWWDCTNMMVSFCNFNNCDSGISFTDGSSGTVRECTFSSMGSYGVVGNRAGTVVLEDSEITVSNPSYVAYGFRVFNPPGIFVLRRNIIVAEGISHCLDFSLPGFSIDAYDNHFLRYGDTSLFARAYVSDSYVGDPLHVDLAGNWWGTTDSTYVAQWIEDRNDDPDLKYYIDFQPMLDHAVPVEKTSMGSVKAMFR
jgi:hypothetical protein